MPEIVCGEKGWGNWECLLWPQLVDPLTLKAVTFQREGNNLSPYEWEGCTHSSFALLSGLTCSQAEKRIGLQEARDQMLSIWGERLFSFWPQDVIWKQGNKDRLLQSNGDTWESRSGQRGSKIGSGGIVKIAPPTKAATHDVIYVYTTAGAASQTLVLHNASLTISWCFFTPPIPLLYLKEKPPLRTCGFVEMPMLSSEQK